MRGLEEKKIMHFSLKRLVNIAISSLAPMNKEPKNCPIRQNGSKRGTKRANLGFREIQFLHDYK